MGLDTLANVKSRLGVTTDADDTFIQQQIDMISDVIEAYCRRKFLTDDYVQTFYGDETCPSASMELFHFPVQAIASLEEDGEALNPVEYRLHPPTGSVRRLYYNFFWATETVVTYTAGYDTCPSPILAVLDALVGERYNKKKAGVDLNFGTDVQRVSIPGAISIDFDYTLTSNERSSAYGSILGNYANVLDDWRSERAVIGSNKLEYNVEA